MKRFFIVLSVISILLAGCGSVPSEKALSVDVDDVESVGVAKSSKKSAKSASDKSGKKGGKTLATSDASQGSADDTLVQVYETDVVFGIFPQTLKASNVKISSGPDENGYYTGSDGAFYTKLVAAPYGTKSIFKNGESCVAGTEYYFKLEPVEWLVLKTEDDGAKILYSKSTLTAKAFSPTLETRKIDGADVDPNSYKHSIVRAFLNGLGDYADKGFLDLAFNATERSKIKPVQIDDMIDSVFILSLDEVNSPDFNFSKEYINERSNPVTDYAVASGAFVSDKTRYEGKGWWWLRDPYKDLPTHENYVSYYGKSGYGSYADSTGGGVVPCIKIK